MPPRQPEVLLQRLQDRVQDDTGNLGKRTVLKLFEDPSSFTSLFSQLQDPVKAL